MPLTPFPVQEFGGLNVVSDPTEVGMAGAVDLLNVALDRPGRVRTRDGFAVFSTSAGAAALNYLAPIIDTFASPRMAAIETHQVDAIDLGTGVRTTAIASGAYGTAVTNITRPTYFSIDSFGPLIYWASDLGTTGAPLKGTDATGGVGFSPRSVSGKPMYVCAVPSRGTNGLAPRLAQAGYFAAADSPSGANGSFSTVFFSDPGTDATWTSTNWLQLDPGDAEKFTGMVAFDGSLYLFKNTKVFEFYGESIQSDGSPVFNYRRISLPDPIPQMTSPTAWQPVAVGPDGIYYAGTRGLWRVGHGSVSRVPTPIDPIIAGTADATIANGTVGGVRMEWAGPVLSIIYTLASTAQRVLVWDTSTNTWTLHSYSKTLSSVPQYVPTFGTALFFGASDGIVYKSTPAVTTDAGTAIAWSYTTGYSDAGGYYRQRIVSSGERKNHFKVDLLGSGTVTHQILTLNSRPNDVADPGGSVTLGTAPALARGSRRRGARGTHFAHKLSGSGQMVVNGMTYWLQGVEQDT